MVLMKKSKESPGVQEDQVWEVRRARWATLDSYEEGHGGNYEQVTDNCYRYFPSMGLEGDGKVKEVTQLRTPVKISVYGAWDN
jgi:hypothetical protein